MLTLSGYVLLTVEQCGSIYPGRTCRFTITEICLKNIYKRRAVEIFVAKQNGDRDIRTDFSEEPICFS